MSGAFEDYCRYSVPNWDGYDAVPITDKTLDTARHLYELLTAEFVAPEVVPGADGTIGFEWWPAPHNKLYLDIGPGMTWSAYWRCPKGRGSIERTDLSSWSVRDRLFVRLPKELRDQLLSDASNGER